MTTPHPTPGSTGPHGAALLDAVHAALTRYVCLPSPRATDAVVLWMAASHAQPAWTHAPRLVIQGPRAAGKSRLLDTLAALCHDPLITVNASPAAVFRQITQDPPTLLVDEADTLLRVHTGTSDTWRGLLTAGCQRRPALRYDATTGRVVEIPTFAMAALAGIDPIPAGIEDRAVVLHLRRTAGGHGRVLRSPRPGPATGPCRAAHRVAAHRPARAGPGRSRLAGHRPGRGHLDTPDRGRRPRRGHLATAGPRRCGGVDRRGD